MKIKLTALLLLLAVLSARAQTFNTIHTFSDNEGSHINSRLVQGSDGNFYGTAHQGGANGQGSIFKVTPAGTVTVIYSFGTVAGDGSFPLAGLTKGNDGNFYGTTTSGNGTIFKVTLTGNLTTLYTLSGNDGQRPAGGLTLASDGNFYGSTYFGGSGGNGTIFKVVTNGTTAGTAFTVLHHFSATSSGLNADGAQPSSRGGLIQGSDGNFYGVTSGGGANGRGIIYKLTSAGTLTNLYDVGTNANDGSFPDVALLEANPGFFYGTMTGGALGSGLVFQMVTNGTRAGTTITSLYTFHNAEDGGAPHSPVVTDSDGNIYGMTDLGGANYQGNSFNQGVLYRIAADATYSVLHSFGTGDGQPHPGVILASDGNLYGTTVNTVFKYGLPPSTPVPPAHGGLSGTVFKVNGSKVPSGNLADTVLRFSALQTGTPAGLEVRVQYNTSNPPGSNGWLDLANGSNGYMTLDKTQSVFVLNSSSYPPQSAVSFRAIASAPGYDTTTSNVVGPFNLAGQTAHLPAITLYMATNGKGAPMNFRTSAASSPAAGTNLRIQATNTPSDEASWANLSDGNQGMMYPFDDGQRFYLSTTHYGTGDPRYFRAVASASGYVDAVSNAIGVKDALEGNLPIVDVLIPLPATGGPGLDADHPLIVSAGTLNFGAHVSDSTTELIQTLGVLYDGNLVDHVDNGATTLHVQYTTNVGGDHIIKAYARDDHGIVGYADPIFIRIPPPSGHVFTMTSSGSWNNAANWQDESGQAGVPGTNDFAVVGAREASITADVTVYAVTMNGGSIAGDGGGLTVTGEFLLAGGQLLHLNTIVRESATMNMVADENVPMSGSLTNYGIFKLAGRGSIVPVPIVHRGGAGNDGLFDGLLAVIKNIGNWIFHPIAKARPAPTPPPVPIIPSHVVVASTFENKGQLLTSDGAGLIGHDGASLIGHDGASLIGHDGASVVANTGLIGQDGAGLLTQDGGGLLTQDGAGRPAPNTSVSAAQAGFTLTSGEVNLDNLTIVGSVLINGGTLSGSGMIDGNLTNHAGYISPGHSAGAISVLGDYGQDSGGTLIVENGGPEPYQYDQLDVKSGANLGGALRIRDINGYTPDSNDTFSPLSFASLSGAFDSISSNVHLTIATNGLLAKVDAATAAPAAGQPLNISTRMRVLTNDRVLIGGFIITGPTGSSKKVLIRGIGSSTNVPGALADPTLELHLPNGTTVTNNDWAQGPRANEIPNDFKPNAKEAVIIADLAPGAYTVIESGVNGGIGVGLTEVYDFETSSLAQLANISTRGFVDTGDNVMIGGFIVGGGEPAQVLVRAIGPSLKNPPSNLTGVLEDPMLELHDSNGSVIANDDWRSAQEAEIIATTIPPSDNKEPAILATLVPGGYTAIVRGKNNTTGLSLIEAYKIK